MTKAAKAYKDKLEDAKTKAQFILDYIDNELNNLVETETSYGYAGNAGHIYSELSDIVSFVKGEEL